MKMIIDDLKQEENKYSLDNIFEFYLKITQTLPEERILLDNKSKEKYSRTTLAKGTTPCLIVKPINKNELEQIVLLANEFKCPFHTISTGKNWGYSDACGLYDNQIIIDLGLMNKILDYNNELGTITVEPGVTQGQVYDFLKEKGDEYWVDATGAGPKTSIIGNIAERGFGHSQNGDRFSNVTDLEVILPSGKFIRTGVSSFENAKCAKTYKWGVGPSIDGLFTQSNLGIITRLTLWLQPKPDDFKVLLFLLKDKESIHPFLDATRKLKMNGTIKSVVHIANSTRMLSMTNFYPWEEMNFCKPLSVSKTQEMLDKSKSSHWFGSIGMYGTKAQIKADVNIIKKTMKDSKSVKKTILIDDNKLSMYGGLLKICNRLGFFKELKPLFNKLTICCELLKGKSPENCVQGALWGLKKENLPKNLSSGDPLDYKAGLYWISPLLPMTGHDLNRMNSAIEPIFHQYGFDMQQTLSMVNGRSLASVLTISFDKRDQTQTKNALLCHDKVFDILFELGYIPYRLGNHSMKYMKLQKKENKEMMNGIKSLLDPNNLFSPNKYIPAEEF
ncbi:MAG: hypothetical protein COA79_20730 [Planctomycetota bacterium]|nr:MAG: hypothetical protein COA79_20730 [Planctomycetota bacterium]